MNENFDDIDISIINQFNDFLIESKEKKYFGDQIWTKRLKERIGTLGVNSGFKVATGGFPNKFEREWLYDIVWYEEDESERLIRIRLIVESEWDRNYSGIKYDFEKLLVGNAERRLLICQSKHSELNNLFNKFKDAIDAFENNHRYKFLFAVLNSDTEDEFHFKTYTKN